MTMHAMRREDRKLSGEEAAAILQKGKFGCLCTAGRTGEPYGVPLSYIWFDGAIYIHGAAVGRKADMLRANPQVCFVVVGDMQPVYDKGALTTNYESVVVFGVAEEVADDKKRHASLRALTEKYLPKHLDKADDYIRPRLATMAVFAIRPAEISGKARRSAP